MRKNDEYKQWITEVKQKIRSTQIKAAIAVNSALIVQQPVGIFTQEPPAQIE